MKDNELTDSQKALRGLAGAMLVGLTSVVVYSAHAGGTQGFLAMMSVGILLAGASAFVGGALGFLFGIPRTLQQESGIAGADGNPAGSETTPLARRIDYRVNTNLEQISDWLTKILVGVGLTQISEIRDGLASLTTFAAQGLGPLDQGQVFAMALLSYSAVLGFLFGYLWTRLFLAGALRVADQAAIGILAAEVHKATEKVETTERKLEALKKQTELDAAALGLASRQLNPSPDLPQVTQEELDAAIAAASRPVKLQIFNQAWEVRANNWRDAISKPKMERTIPVFRALIGSDVQNQYHMNHGQLGFALKDMTQPQWAEAESQLTMAIDIRGPWNKHGWLFYEFNRAVCRIMSDPAFLQDHPTSADRKNQILEDLRVAVHAKDIERILRAEPAIQKWMSLNDISRKDLSTA
jgi:hypothetical protein